MATFIKPLEISTSFIKEQFLSNRYEFLLIQVRQCDCGENMVNAIYSSRRFFNIFKGICGKIHERLGV